MLNQFTNHRDGESVIVYHWIICYLSSYQTPSRRF
jgi:hypothetical protein